MTTYFLYLMAGAYILLGINHFVMPKLYHRMIPPYLPNPRLLNLLAGVAEVVLGAGLLFDATRSLAALGIVLMLVAFIPVHIYMLQDRHVIPFAPGWALWLRLFFQLALIYAAYIYI